MLQIIYKGKCVDSDDPKRLGRIRAHLQTENIGDRDKSVDYTKWDDDDPFVFKPLLPFFINTPALVDEYVHLIYSDVRRKGSKDKYYIGGVYSSPTTSNLEVYESAVTNLEEGTRNKLFPDILNIDGTYFNPENEGVYANPEDVTLYGRGSADIIIKNDSVILRAGKNKNFEKGEIPSKYGRRSFIQLSKYDTKTTYGSPEKTIKLKFDHKKIKILIEYTLLDASNASDVFTGDINIYKLDYKKPNSIGSDNMEVDTDVPNELKGTPTTIHFTNMAILDVIRLINQTLNAIVSPGNLSSLVNDETPNINIIGNSNFSTNDDSKYPIYFRPAPGLYNKIKNISNTDSNMITQINISVLMGGIKTDVSDLTPGYGLIFDETKSSSVPFKTEKNEHIPINQELVEKTVNLIGSDEIYLLSHNATKLNGQNIDLTNTINGIDEFFVSDTLEPNTSSLVRGEELIKLLDLIVKFTISHVHAYHGMSPNSVSTEGVSKDDLVTEIQNAADVLLNKFIRIN